MQQRDGPAGVVQAVEVDDARIRKQRGTLSHQGAGSQQTELLRVGEDHADGAVVRQLIEHHKDRDERAGVVHRSR